MKQFFVLLCAVSLLFSCGGSSSSTKALKVDFQMLSQPENVKTIYANILAKAGENVTKVDKVSIMIDRPSTESYFKKEGAPDELSYLVSYMSPTNKNMLEEVTFMQENNKWEEPKQYEINVLGGEKAAENFRLENILFDLTTLTPDVLVKIVADAQAKLLDPTKYSLQYVKRIDVDRKKVHVTVYGIFSANEQKNLTYYDADLNGKEMN